MCCESVVRRWSSFFFLCGTGELGKRMVGGFFGVEGGPEGVGFAIRGEDSLCDREVMSGF